MLLPFVTAVLMTYVAHTSGEIFAFGGYKAALEEEVTKRVNPIHHVGDRRRAHTAENGFDHGVSQSSDSLS